MFKSWGLLAVSRPRLLSVVRQERKLTRRIPSPERCGLPNSIQRLRLIMASSLNSCAVPPLSCRSSCDDHDLGWCELHPAASGYHC